MGSHGLATRPHEVGRDGDHVYVEWQGTLRTVALHGKWDSGIPLPLHAVATVGQ